MLSALCSWHCARLERARTGMSCTPCWQSAACHRLCHQCCLPVLAAMGKADQGGQARPVYDEEWGTQSPPRASGSQDGGSAGPLSNLQAAPDRQDHAELPAAIMPCCPACSGCARLLLAQLTSKMRNCKTASGFLSAAFTLGLAVALRCHPRCTVSA